MDQPRPSTISPSHNVRQFRVARTSHFCILVLIDARVWISVILGLEMRGVVEWEGTVGTTPGRTTYQGTWNASSSQSMAGTMESTGTSYILRRKTMRESCLDFRATC
jgi:hypothetical protein